MAAAHMKPWNGHRQVPGRHRVSRLTRSSAAGGRSPAARRRDLGPWSCATRVHESWSMRLEAVESAEVMSAIGVERDVKVRRRWRSVAIPSEHGGWGLTLEPVVLGLLVAPSLAGLALGVAAFTAFLLRTPAKLIAVDVRRGRWLDRTRLAAARRDRRDGPPGVRCRGGGRARRVGRGWCPWSLRLRSIAVEFSFDIRSRGRRLIPELCGAVGISAVAASIVIAAGRSGGLAAGRVARARRPSGRRDPVRAGADRAPPPRSWPGVAERSRPGRQPSSSPRSRSSPTSGCSSVRAGWPCWPPRRSCGCVARRCRPKQIGLRQMGMGLALVAVTAAGVLW